MKKKMQKKFDELLNLLSKIKCVMEKVEPFRIKEQFNDNVVFKFSESLKRNVDEAFHFVADVNTKYVTEDFVSEKLNALDIIKKEDKKDMSKEGIILEQISTISAQKGLKREKRIIIIESLLRELKELDKEEIKKAQSKNQFEFDPTTWRDIRVS